jgi:hypothetical protein
MNVPISIQSIRLDHDTMGVVQAPSGAYYAEIIRETNEKGVTIREIASLKHGFSKEELDEILDPLAQSQEIFRDIKRRSNNRKVTSNL